MDEFKEFEEDVQDLDEASQEAADQFHSSFEYHARPLDEIVTTDENGIEFTLAELMELKDLTEDID